MLIVLLAILGLALETAAAQSPIVSYPEWVTVAAGLAAAQCSEARIDVFGNLNVTRYFYGLRFALIFNNTR